LAADHRPVIRPNIQPPKPPNPFPFPRTEPMDNKTNRIELHFLQQFFPRFSSIFFCGWGVSFGRRVRFCVVDGCVKMAIKCEAKISV